LIVDELLDILLGDSATQARAFDLREADAMLAGYLAY